MHATDHESTVELFRLADEAGLKLEQMIEMAGWHAVQVFRELAIPKRAHVVVLVGKGTNGGCGLAAARHLMNYGASVQIIMVDKRVMKSARPHLKIAEHMHIPIWHFKHDTQACVDLLSNADIVIDALIGSGIQGSPKKPYAELIEGLNMRKATVISYDVPTGINPADKTPTNTWVRANATISLGALKESFLSPNISQYCGRIFVVDIGIPGYIYDHIQARCRPEFDERGIVEFKG